MSSRKVVVITGPTATGKTALGAAVAKMVDGEVVSADSMQVYKHMDVGTAKPSEAEKMGVPHHMIDVVAPWEDYSVARYVQEATLHIDDVLRRGKTPVIVGGTGLYIDSLISGREFSTRGDETRRRELGSEYDEHGGEAMLHKLRCIDPDSAAKLHANDKKRIVRALEVFETTGETISKHDAETKTLPPRYSAAKFACTYSRRQELYARIEARVDEMMSRGLADEVRNLLDMGVSPGCTSMQAIGYKEIAQALLGDRDMAAAAEKIKLESRHYAKRQLTWLRRDADVNWISWEEEPDFESALQLVLRIANNPFRLIGGACEKK